MRATRRTLTTTAVAALTVVALAACSGGDTSADPTSTPSASGDLYAQVVEWSDCGDDLECATVTAPLDWDDPEGETIDLALNRHVATGDRLGSLLFNPGGPGVSGVTYLEYGVDVFGFGEDVIESYDIVAFDPRGVGQSTAVTCLEGAELDAYLAGETDGLTDEESYAAGLQASADFYAACAKNSGPLLEHVSTVDAARDMDLIRAVLGEDTLNYLGFSYGTFLGTTYAALFPENVGRMVLDGAIDPTTTVEEDTLVQAEGFENALRAYVTDCQTGANCPLTGSVDDGMTQIATLFDTIEASPMTTDSGRSLTVSLAFYGLIYPLYSQDAWPYLTIALNTAINDNDGTMMLLLSDTYLERGADGEYASNQNSAIAAINCADQGPYDLTYAQAQDPLAQLTTVAPTMAEFFAGSSCAGWPTVEGGLDDYSAAGAAPILVVGTTNDPATPYRDAEALASILESGTLLTFEGEGHTAYGSSNSCILDAVDDYLTDGVVPAEGTRC